jgi:hypothetical protein
MKLFKLFFGLIFLSLSLQLKGQTTDSIPLPDTLPPLKPDYTWKNLAKGIQLIETDAPKRSIIGDSKLTILKLDPRAFDFYLITATEYKTKKTVCEWADTFSFNVVMNAGMYDLSNGLINRGFMKTHEHYNNRNFNPSYKAMIAMHPVDSMHPKFDILDLHCEPWEKVNNRFHTYAQGLRMIDCNGEPLGWNKRNQSCSMLVAALDHENNLYYIFSRSPYTHNEMISFMLDFPFELTNAIYLEGGPETSLYVCIGDTVLEKLGSYVSNTYPTDANEHFWRLPNVIGLKAR